MKKIFVLLSLLFLVACSKNTETKKVKVNFSSLLGTQVLNSIMVYGKNNLTGDHFGFALIEGDPLNDSITIETGTWDFAVVGWDSVVPTKGTTLTGTVRCATIENELIEADTTIDFTVLKANCNETFFGDSTLRETDGQFKEMVLYNCFDFASGNPDNSECTQNSGVGSYRVVLNSFSNSATLPGNGLNDLDSCLVHSNDCLNGDKGCPLNTGFKMPAFSAGDNIPLTIETYSSNDCSGSTNSTYFFSNSLSQGIGTTAQFITANSKNQVVLNLDTSNICVTGANNTPFAQGAYSETGTNFICNKAQLLAISDSTTYFAGTYELKNSIDLGGDDIFSDVIGNKTNQFTGTFEGNDNTISNYTIGTGTTSYIGLFANVSGGTVKNLKVDTVTITGSGTSRIGAVVGLSQGNSTIENITASNITFNNSGGQYNGGVVGLAEGGVLRRLTATNVTINNGGSSNGGVIGYIDGNNNTDVQYLSANNISITAGSDIGGVIGTAALTSASSTMVMAHIFANGVTLTQTGSGANYGGVFGYLLTGVAGDYRDYAATGVNINVVNTVEVGGVIGKLTTDTAAVTFKNLAASSTLTVANTTVNYNVGGIMGSHNGTSGATISHMKATSTINVDKVENTGGLIGLFNASGTSIYEYGAANMTMNCTGTGCHNVGGGVGKAQGGTTTYRYATHSGSITSVGNNTGGAVGYMLGTGKTVSQVGTSVTVSSTGIDVGGLIGNMSGALSNSYTSGNLSGTNTVGGMVGTLASGGSVLSTVAIGTVTSATPTSGVAGSNLSSPICATGCHFNSVNTLNGGNIGSASSRIVANMTNITNHNSTFYGGLDFTAATGIWTAATTTRGPFLSWENLATAFAGTFHSGGLHDPWPTTTTAQWNSFNEYPLLHNDITIRLDTNIDFNGESFVPLGGGLVNQEFTGEILGNNKTMSNINYTVTDHYNGIMRQGHGVEVSHYDYINDSYKSLNIANMDISTATKEQNAALIGRMAGTQPNIIRNVNIDADSSFSGSLYAASLIGFTDSTASENIIEDITSAATISGGRINGGIIGFIPTGNYTMKNLTFTGSVTATQDSNAGIIGRVDGGSINLDRCQNTGDISSTNNAGGVFGVLNGTGTIVISRCSNTGNISGNIGNSAGGFIGFTNVTGSLTVNDSYSTGNVSTTASTPQTEFGGFVGSGGGTFNRNYSTGSVTNNGTPFGDAFAGSGTIAGADNFANNDVDATPNGAFGTSASSMTFKGTYTNWDFDTIWTINEGVSFPSLQ